MKTVLFLTSSSRHSCRDRLSGIYRFAMGKGWRVQVIERERMKLSLPKLLELWKPEGAIAECGHEFPELSSKVFKGVPLVYLCEDPAVDRRRGCFVNADEKAIGRSAACELLSLSMVSYAFVGFEGGCCWSDARLRSFSDAIEVNGEKCYVFDRERKVRTSSRLNALKAWLKTLPKPCGVFAAHDPVAEEVIVAAANAGIRMPEQLTVIGVDDNTDICERTVPTLTSIRPDFELGGYLAAKFLDERMSGRSGGFHVETFPPIYVTHRHSTGRSGVSDALVLKTIEAIRRQACGNFSTDDAVKVMKCSRRSAEMRFLAQTGHTIHDEIVSVRMERARELLMKRDQPVDGIADALGWKSRAAFRTAFKKVFGCTPLAWRMKAQGR